MNIADEAVKRYPVDQVLIGDGVSFYDADRYIRDAFIEGAEWARKEAPLEAAEEAEADMFAEDIASMEEAIRMMRSELRRREGESSDSETGEQP